MKLPQISLSLMMTSIKRAKIGVTSLGSPKVTVRRAVGQEAPVVTAAVVVEVAVAVVAVVVEGEELTFPLAVAAAGLG
jgi:hypothetical protein